MPALKMTLGGEDVEVKELAKPKGQFTHFYIDRNGDPHYIIIRQVDDDTYATFSPAVDEALAAGLASGRWCFLFGVIKTTKEGEPPTLDLYKTTCDFPYDAFKSMKQAVVGELDKEIVTNSGQLKNANLKDILDNTDLAAAGQVKQLSENPDKSQPGKVVSVMPFTENSGELKNLTMNVPQKEMNVPQEVLDEQVRGSAVDAKASMLPNARPADQTEEESRHLQAVHDDFAKTLAEMNETIRPLKKQVDEMAAEEKKLREEIRTLKKQG